MCDVTQAHPIGGKGEKGKGCSASLYLEVDETVSISC